MKWNILNKLSSKGNHERNYGILGNNKETIKGNKLQIKSSNKTDRFSFK